MDTISVVIIAKNSEHDIAKCLSSLSFCNEIIVVDSGSKDKTVDIAKKAGAVIIIDSSEDFAKRRNMGMKKAKGQWVLYVDTDEVISEELQKNIQNVLAKNGKTAAYEVQRKNFYFGNKPWPYIEKTTRLFKKDTFITWKGALHESPKYKGETGYMKGYLYHFTHKNLAAMLEKTIVWSQVEAKLRYDVHHPPMTWWRFIRIMITGFYNSYIKQKGYKAGTVGLVESIYQAYSMFVTYARLWEMQQKESPSYEKID